MRLIDADALINELVNSCNNDQTKMFPVWIEKQIDAQPTIPCDMRWNPDCEDCKQEDSGDCDLKATINIDTLENVLSEQQEIVRCKDCKHQVDNGRRYKDCDLHFLQAKDEWFCADGEPEGQETY